MALLKTDLWRTGIVRAPLGEIVAAGSLEPFETVWLPADRPMCFTADPFGLWHDGRLHLFAEFYDYRTKSGVIEAIVLDAQFRPIARKVVLRESWHLSYPFVFEAEGAIWMMPEAYKSGRLSLYRATEFPWKWEREPRFDFPCGAVDATPLFMNGQWWLFYSPPVPGAFQTAALKIAVSDTLFGPWKDLSDRPVHLDRGGARMGGTPFCHEGKVILPTQDCLRTYGGAIRLVEIDLADPSAPRIRPGARLTPPASYAPYTDGLHTLSAAGEVTLIDAKRIVHTPRRLGIELGRTIGYYRRR